MLIAAAFHIVRPDLDPIRHGVSRYEWGAHGSIMSVGLVLLGVSLCLSAALESQPLLLMSGLGAIVVAMVPLPDHPSLVANVIHQSAGVVLFVGAAAGMLTIALEKRAERLRVGAARFAVVALVVFALVAAVRLPFVGLTQRALLAAICAWLIAGTPAGPQSTTS